MTTAVAEPVRILNAQDRCDRCQAQALHVASWDWGGELLFCGHHFNEFAAGLVAAGAKVSTP